MEDMTIEDVKSLIASDESRILELKKTTGELKDGMHSACAFLNTEGGWLIFGVTPNSLKIVGQQVTESWGSGAKRVIEACEEQGVEPPTWRMDGGFVTVTFKRPKKDPSTTHEGPMNDPRRIQEGPKKNSSANNSTSTPPVDVHQYSTSTPPVRTLLAKASGEYLSARELAGLCGITDIRYFRKYYLNPAIDEGVVERLYPDKIKYPKQRYRLTEAAATWKINQASYSLSCPPVVHQPTPPVVNQYSTSTTSVQILISHAGYEYMSAKMLSEFCGIGDVNYFRKHYLNPAIEEGAVERMYPEQINHPRQKYRLTEAALIWKSNQSHFSNG